MTLKQSTGETDIEMGVPKRERERERDVCNPLPTEQSRTLYCLSFVDVPFGLLGHLNKLGLLLPTSGACP